MVSCKQRRVWKYVDEGSFLKLKSYLRKHRELDVNFSRGRRERSPLQLACSLRDDAALWLLLQHGADVLQKDREGDTALHIAVKRALKHGKKVYNGLVLPLTKTCPEALNAPNRAGLSPQDLLNGRKQTQTEGDMSSSSESDPEMELMEKRFGELVDKLLDTFGQRNAECKKHFRDSADRVRRQRGWKSKLERELNALSNKEQRARLQRERKEFLARAARREEETLQGRKRMYDEMCAATVACASSSGGAKLSYSDISWPAPQGTVLEMLDVMLHGVDRKDVPVFRKMLRKQQALWHPDKFAQQCEARLEEKDKKRILDTVTALSQELNRLAQSLRT